MAKLAYSTEWQVRRVSIDFPQDKIHLQSHGKNPLHYYLLYRTYRVAEWPQDKERCRDLHRSWQKDVLCAKFFMEDT